MVIVFSLFDQGVSSAVLLEELSQQYNAYGSTPTFDGDMQTYNDGKFALCSGNRNLVID